MVAQICTFLQKRQVKSAVWKKNLNRSRKRATFINSFSTYLLSTWRAVCVTSVSFLWIILIAICIFVPRSSELYSHTTLKQKIKL